MSRGLLETILGAVVLAVAIGFGILVFSSRPGHVLSHYNLKVYFESAQGLKTQTDVRLGGVAIGHVEGIHLDTQTLEAVVSIKIRENIALPANSRAEIATAGLLGDTFLKIIPGTPEEQNHSGVLADGGEIRQTESPVSLEDLLGKAIFALTKH